MESFEAATHTGEMGCLNKNWILQRVMDNEDIYIYTYIYIYTLHGFGCQRFGWFKEALDIQVAGPSK